MPALIYAAMDWLEGRQGAIEAELAAATWHRRPARRGWRCSCPGRPDPRRDRRLHPPGRPHRRPGPGASGPAPPGPAALGTGAGQPLHPRRRRSLCPRPRSPRRIRRHHPPVPVSCSSASTRSPPQAHPGPGRPLRPAQPGPGTRRGRQDSLAPGFTFLGVSNAGSRPPHK